MIPTGITTMAARSGARNLPIRHSARQPPNLSPVLWSNGMRMRLRWSSLAIRKGKRKKGRKGSLVAEQGESLRTKVVNFENLMNQRFYQ